MLKPDTIAIIGAGFSGTLLAINLLRHDGPKTILIEREPRQIARGVAYGTAHQDHILNVRAGNMSAFPDQPDHFVNWLAQKGSHDRTSFVARSIYGDYLRETLSLAFAAHPDRLTIIQAEAHDIAFHQNGPEILLSNGHRIAADAIVLAQGNLPPHDLPQFSHLAASGSLYTPDPWATGGLEGLSDEDTVLLIGSGLTAVDVALKLDSAGFRGKVIALSRRGLSPRTHLLTGPAIDKIDRPALNATDLVSQVRSRALEVGWHAAIDELRPHTQNIWRAASDEERSRFLRHLRPFWDVHRHRLSPAVAQRITDIQRSGRLEFRAGKIARVVPEGHKVLVEWRPRGTDELESVRVSRIINCTGPQGDLLRTSDLLLRNLTQRGVIRADSQNLGIDVDMQGRVVESDGKPSETIYAIGPMTRGAFWEVIAVPDLRHQAWTLARKLSASHWVGGEGL